MRRCNQHVAWPGGDEVRDVKARRAPQHAWHTFVAQQALYELRFGLVAAACNLDESTLPDAGVMRGSAPHDFLLLAWRSVHEVGV